jgi:hypothetical protein
MKIDAEFGERRRRPRGPALAKLLIYPAVLAAALMFVHAMRAADTPAEWQAEAVKTATILGRTVIRYEHDCLPQWGYTEPRRDYFYIVLPEKTQQAPPLVVLLHSAGGSGEKELEANVRLVVGAGPEFAGLVPNAAPSRQLDWWWGAELLKERPRQYRSQLTPAENRVLATVEWAARNQNADRNRIYLHGISMGGSGTLGLGLCHGDIFAAICAQVPAGVDHVMQRMNFPQPPAKEASVDERQEYLRRISGIGLPDAPPLLVFASQLDKWSKGQESFMQALRDGRHAVIFTWGPWGHKNVYDRYHRAAYEFPWFEIRKNQAYPVFTFASTDDHYPGHQSTEADQEGQVNALFRWKNLEDAPARFAIELRLVREDELRKPVKLPAESVADVTFRRLQRFKVRPTGQAAWRLLRQGEIIASGTIRPDIAGLLTVPHLTISREPLALVLALR